MKLKVLLATAGMLAAWSLVHAGDGPLVGTPRGGPQALASADYGGVFYSTNCAFGPVSGAGVGYSTVTIPQVGDRTNTVRGVFYGVVFTTSDPQAFNYVDVYDSTSSNRARDEGAIMRLYNNYNTLGSTSVASGFSGPPKPIRFNKGLILRAGQSNLNMVTALFYREP